MLQLAIREGQRLFARTRMECSAWLAPFETVSPAGCRSSTNNWLTDLLRQHDPCYL